MSDEVLSAAFEKAKWVVILGNARSIAARLNQLFLNLAKSQKIKAMLLIAKNGRNARPRNDGTRKVFGSTRWASELETRPIAKMMFTAKSTFLTKVRPFNVVLVTCFY
jgi:hypothetical protein